jgi:hypothetical protein
MDLSEGIIPTGLWEGSFVTVDGAYCFRVAQIVTIRAVTYDRTLRMARSGKSLGKKGSKLGGLYRRLHADAGYCVENHQLVISKKTRYW